MAHPTIDSHLGSFLLGSTSPDIRILTKGKRDDTHFATLQVQSIGIGVAGLFHSYPAIADSSKVSGPTRAFLSGYLVHLLADEAWILDIYRPYFDDPLLFPDRVHANISDRALQLDMDRVAREEMGDMDQVRSSLDGSESGVVLGFIGPETLGEWREWVTEFTRWAFSWERLRFASRRMYRDDAGAMERVEGFLQGMPGSLARLYDKIPDGTIEAYHETVIGESVRFIKEYLGASERDKGAGPG